MKEIILIWYQQKFVIFHVLKTGYMYVYLSVHTSTRFHVYRKAVLATCFDTWINERKKYFARVVCIFSITSTIQYRLTSRPYFCMRNAATCVLSFKLTQPPNPHAMPIISVLHAQCTSFTCKYKLTETDHEA